MKRRLVTLIASFTIASFCVGCGSEAEKELNVDNVDLHPIVEDKPVIVDENGNIIYPEVEEYDDYEDVDTAASTGTFGEINKETDGDHYYKLSFGSEGDTDESINGASSDTNDSLIISVEKNNE